MYIIYLDESGTHKESRHFVLAGLAVFERDTYHLAQAMDGLQRKYFPQHTHPINLHASALAAPDEQAEEPFNGLSSEDRLGLLREVYPIIAASQCRLFGVVIEKSHISDNPYERAFEDIVSRFDQMLRRFFLQNNQQRGLFVVAESGYRENLECWPVKLLNMVTAGGETHNLADIPYFAPAASMLLLQLADFVSNSVYRRYEHRDYRTFDTIMPRFDQEGGRVHGLMHLTADRSTCYCPAYLSRRAQA